MIGLMHMPDVVGGNYINSFEIDQELASVMSNVN